MPGLSGLSVLARGGYATVFRAVQESVGREVAVKVENRTLDSERDQRRFLREARAAGRMSSHPHVVDLFDAGVTTDQHPYLIMELCRGSYAERMRTRPLGAAETRDVGIKIADALADAHALGVLHRDVKPANILYSNFGEPALADFGLAILAEARDASITLEVLTPAYAPPEMFGHSDPSPCADVYALSATLYALMRGKPPRWNDDRAPSLITLMEMFKEPIPDLPGVPPELLDVLRAGMANDADARPTAEQLRDALVGLPLEPFPAPPASGPPGPPVPSYGGQPDDPAIPNHPTRPLNVAAPSPATPVELGGGSAWRMRLRWFLGGLGAVLLLAAAAGGGWAVGVNANRGRPTPPTALATPSRAPTGRAGGLAAPLPGCLVALPSGVRCPSTVDCYDEVAVAGGVARATPVRCDSAHTWEVFAVGDLPAGMRSMAVAAVHAATPVTEACTRQTFLLTTLQMSEGWSFDVLPPTPEAYAAGDRLFRCLAGRGPGSLTAPTLAR